MVSRIMPMLGDKVGDFAIGTAHFVVMGKSREEGYEKMRRIIPQETWEDFMKARIRQEIRHRIAGSPKECILKLG